MENSKEQLSFFLQNAERDTSLSQSSTRDAQWFEDFRLNLFALSLVRGIGEVSLKALLKAFPTPVAVWEATSAHLNELFLAIGLKAPQEVVKQILNRRHELVERAKYELERLSKDNIHFLTFVDEKYPERLRQTKDAPRWLFVQGDVTCLSMPNLVAVVGTRAASPAGLDRARTLTKYLAEKNIGIVSGLAEGIDEAAHKAALDFGVRTIGVLGTGIFLYFPASTSALRRRIINESGAVITEYLPNDSFSRARFVRRNRIQAALAFAIVPVEGRASSGTAHTYRFAKEYGKVTFGITKGKARAEDGILDLLRIDNRPVFDLESADDMRTLTGLLSPIVNSPKVADKGERVGLPLLKDFKAYLQKTRISEEEFDQLILELRDIWREKDGG